jgi:transitional endoplasmic reticulum ATPase
MTIQLPDLSAFPAIDAAALTLLPSQEAMYARLKRAAESVPVIAYIGPHGMGRTTLLRRLASERPCTFIDGVKLQALARQYTGGKFDEVVYGLVRDGLDRHGMVIFDDFPEYIRRRTVRNDDVLGPLYRSLSDRAIRENKLLILAGNYPMYQPFKHLIFGEAAAEIATHGLTVADYAAFFGARFGARVEGVNFQLLHSLASKLNMYQLAYIANRVDGLPRIDFDALLHCIETEILGTSLNLKEVEALSFDSLPGSEHIAEALETHVVLPFEQKELAHEMGLKARRGVLLYGPPGTGKTSIGRALAHRMQGRFFLIDGSFVTEPPSGFFAQIESVVAQAKAHAPCVLFIDDADVLFQIEHIAGLSRYLLSLLDGIESETASKVCIMLTAMDPAKLPAALLRSGRVELWLGTRPPTPEIRARILQRWMVDDMPGYDQIDYARIAAETEGFTPADLRRLTSDAKLFYAADVLAERKILQAEAYLDLALEDLASLRETMAARVAADSVRSRYYA